MYKRCQTLWREQRLSFVHFSSDFTYAISWAWLILQHFQNEGNVTSCQWFNFTQSCNRHSQKKKNLCWYSPHHKQKTLVLQRLDSLLLHLCCSLNFIFPLNQSLTSSHGVPAKFLALEVRGKRPYHKRVDNEEIEIENQLDCPNKVCLGFRDTTTPCSGHCSAF